MDERSLRVLEYSKIKDMLAGLTACSLGKQRALSLQPRDDLPWIRDRLAETSEIRRLLETAGSLPLGGLTDIGPLVGRARTYGLLDPSDLLRVSDALRCARRMQGYLAKGAEEAPMLSALAETLSVHQDIEDEIKRCIDDDANVRSHASDELHRLTVRSDTLERRVRERVESILRAEVERGTLQEPVIVQREGRFCLPVQANNQSRVRGVVQGRSDSGATVFMEPLEVVEVGNELRGTLLDIEAEVERILRAITSRVAEVAEPLEANLRALGVIDFIGAKGALAQTMNATEPEVVAEPQLRLLSARHPLVTGKVVPVDVWIGDQFSTLLITGPNTGGKTVTLKTVGLCALMAQSGLHIPAGVGSQVTVWNYIYADIGDEQSIEQSLSTFSGHMTQIVKIINRVNAHQRNQQRRGSDDTSVRALVLLDEIGAGTDPTEGAALARAILTELHEAGCRTVATTHYNDLKAFAYGNAGMENASVEFDAKTLQPTYKLLIGHAGSSNAFEVAQRLGLARSIVRRGREFLTDEQFSFDQAVTEVERQQRTLRDQTKEAQSTQRDLEGLRERYEKDLEKLEARKQKAIEAGFDEARDIVRRAEEQARQIIADLQSQTRQSKVTQQRREDIATLRREVESEAARAVEPVQDAAEPPPDEEEPVGLPYVLMGDPVHVPALGRDGTVIGVPRDGIAEVQIGNVRVEAKLTELLPPVEQSTEDSARLAETMQTRKSVSVPREIDVRGTTVEEALLDLERYLDDVTLARFQQVRIIHGKGTGALRRGIHEFLKKHRQVRDFRLAEHEQGGEGATEVFF